MLQTLTAKVQVFPSDSEKEILKKSMLAYQAACNKVSKHVFETKDLKQSNLNKMFYYGLRSEFGLRSQMAQSAIRTVIAAYKTMLLNHEWSEAKFEHGFVDLVFGPDYSLKPGCFSVNSLTGRLKLKYASKGLEKYFDSSTYRFGTAKLICRRNRFYLCISVKHDVPDVDSSQIRNVVGIDRGINFLVATYDLNGKSGFYSGRQIKNKKANYRRLRRELQMRNTSSAKRRLKRINQRENRWMSDVNHRISKALVESNPTGTLFAIEDLKNSRKNMLVRRYSSGSRAELVSWSYFDLETKLTYKAVRAGDMVVKFNPAYTSQTCPKCGHVEKSNRNKILHRFECRTCHYRSNDDRIAAMNLYRLGVGYLAHDDQSTVDSE